MAPIFLEKPFPWIQGVSQLPSATRGTGALDFCDILYHMPLSLLNIVGNVLPYMVRGCCIAIYGNGDADFVHVL